MSSSQHGNFVNGVQPIGSYLKLAQLVANGNAASGLYYAEQSGGAIYLVKNNVITVSQAGTFADQAAFTSAGSSAAYGEGNVIIAGQQYYCDGVGLKNILNDTIASSYNLVPKVSKINLPDVACGPGFNLPIDSPYDGIGNGTNLHGCIRVSTERFGGYKYWLAYTPYPNADSQYENPCVMASNDFKTWVAPAANPVVAKPNSHPMHYNSDTSLCFSADGKTLYLIYRTATTNYSVLIRSSTDGITWSAPITALTAAAAAHDYASPSMTYNPALDRYELFSHNFISGSRPIERTISSTNNPMGAWGTPAAITLPPTGARFWWHSDFQIINGLHIGVAQEPAVNANDGNTVMVYSADGVNFTRSTAKFPGSYRPSFFVDTDGAPYLLISKLVKNFFTVYPLLSSTDLSNLLSLVASAVSAANPLAIVRDTFTRTNAASWGNTDNGIAWVTQLGTAATDGATGGLTTSGCRVVCPINAKNFYAQFTIAQASDANNYIVFRASNPAITFYRMGNAAGLSYFNKYVAGNLVTNLVITGDIAALFVTGAKVGVLCVDDYFSLFVNGQCVHTEQDLDTVNGVLTGNYVGAQENHTTTYLKIDDFCVIQNQFNAY